MKFALFDRSSPSTAATFLTVVACAGLATSACGQAGALDATFDIGTVTASSATTAVVTTVAEQADGKVLFGGVNLKTVNGTAVQPIVRTNADGSLDGNFTPPAIESYDTRTDSIITSTNPSYKPTVETVVPMADGTILVGGSFYFINGTSGFGGLVRLNSDGTYDSSFTTPRFNGTVYAVAKTSDGKYIVGGDFNVTGNNTRTALVRLSASGNLDTSFNPGAFAGTLINSVDTTNFTGVHSLAIQSDGKIVIGGVFSSINGTVRRGLARINADGTLDKTFTAYSGFNPPASGYSDKQLESEVLAVTIQSDGKILVGGYFSNVTSSGSTPINSLYRLNSDGSQDTAFASGDGTADTSLPNDQTYVNAIALQADGKILIGGGFDSYADVSLFGLTRLNADGTLDYGFGGNQLQESYNRYGPDQTVQALAVQTDGKLLIGGFFDGYYTPAVQDVDSTTEITRDLVARVQTASVLTVVIAANPAKAVTTEDTIRPGVVMITRSGGDTSTSLTVTLALGGNAQPGVNYKVPNALIPAGNGLYSVTFNPNQTVKNLNIRALETGDTTAKTTATFTLQTGNAYFINSEEDAASVKLVARP